MPPWEKYQKQEGPWNKYQDKEDFSLGPMPFVNKRIAEILGYVPDVLIGGTSEMIERISGKDLAEPLSVTKGIKAGMEAIGAEIPEREPKKLTEYMGQGIGEVSTLMFPFAGIAQKLSQGTNLVAKISQGIISSIGKYPWLSMGSELAGGAGAGLGRGVGKEQYPDSPMMQGLLELGGGVTGGISPTLFKNSPVALAIRMGKPLLKKVVLPFTEQGGLFRGGAFVKKQVVSPTGTIKKITEKSISDLPPAIKSGEKRLIELYKSLSSLDPIDEVDAIERVSKSIITLESSMRKLGYGSPELLQEITQRRMMSINARIDKRITNALERAQAKIDKIPVAQRKANEARIVRDELEKTLKVEWDDVKKLWKDVPKDIQIGFDKTRAKFAEIKTGLSEAQQVDIPLPLKTNSIITNKKLEATTIKEMQGLRSKLLEVARDAEANYQWNKARIANEVADSILEDIGIVAGQANTPEAAKLKVALNATRQFKQKYETGITGKILGRRSGVPAIDPDLTLEVSVGRMGEKGAIDVGKVAPTPEAMKATERYLGRNFTDYVTNKGARDFDPQKATQWMSANEALLDKFPQLKKTLSDAVDAQQFANDTRVAMEARKARLQNPNISKAQNFLKFADINMAVESIIKHRTPGRMAYELTQQARKDPTGNALNGLRAGFIDYMIEKASTGPYDELGRQILSGRNLRTFIHTNRDAIKQLFTGEQINRINRIASELVQAETYFKAKPQKIELELDDIASSFLKFAGRWGGARLGGWLGKGSAGGSIQTANIFSERLKGLARWLSRDRAVQLVNDAILSEDPQLLKTLLLPVEKPTIHMKNILEINRRLNTWLLGTGSRIAEDISREEK